jgi:hypothetical protein
MRRPQLLHCAGCGRSQRDGAVPRPLTIHRRERLRVAPEGRPRAIGRIRDAEGAALVTMLGHRQ